MRRIGWFGPKWIGWGIGPRSCEGWVVVALWAGSMTFFAKFHAFTIGLKIFALSVLTLAFFSLVLITYRGFQ